ncbi:copper transporter [Nocardia uniformis]|uniref:Copper transporter n=1 Tax=Nocardia uniformis TaxID=53432 RepID=A0A849BZ23_9NOCA|nr:copper transporter [Nocardia uniformis]NNH70386.1 copper transporter [Nocardia uniformis]
MISLRYHAVSIAAVFLALALGVVLGTSTHPDGLLSGRGESGGQVDDLRADNARLEEQLRAADAFMAGAAPKLLSGSLSDRSVLVFTTPDADLSDIDSVTKALTTAGASVAGRVALTNVFTDSSEGDRLRTALANLVPAGAQLNTGAVDQGTLGGDLLGLLLLTDPANGNPRGTDAERALALETLRGGGFLTADAARPANLAVVITGDGQRADENQRGTIIARFAGGLKARGAGVVLAGRHGAAEGAGPLAVARDEAPLATVTTVDNVDREIGRLTTALGLTEQMSGGTGRYGTGERATSLTVAAMPR